MKVKKHRELTVLNQSGYNHNITPTIMLKGQWLQEFGFEIGEKVSVDCEHGQMIIKKIEKNC